MFMDRLMLLGLLGQFCFFMRFFVQWIYSEKAKESVVPDVFWVFSLLGGFLLFVYSLLRQDLPFALGTGFGCLIYIRNLWFVFKRRRLQNVR